MHPALNEEEVNDILKNADKMNEVVAEEDPRETQIPGNCSGIGEEP